MAEANQAVELTSAFESLALEEQSTKQVANKTRKKRPQKKDVAAKNVQKSPTRPRPGAQQPLRVAASETGLCLSDPGNLHPKRKGQSSRNKSSGNTSQHSQLAASVLRRKSDTSSTRDSMRSPLPPSLKYQHQVHKCSWSDAGSVSSRSSTDLLSSPGPSRAGQAQPHSFSYSVPTTPNQKSRRGQTNAFHPFDAFLPLCEIQAGLKKGEFFEGTLRVNPRCFEDSFISAPETGPHWDIYIEGRHSRNRALSGDKVAVALLPKEEWKVHWNVILSWEKKNGVSLLSSLQALTNCKLPRSDAGKISKQKLATLEEVIKEEIREDIFSDEDDSSTGQCLPDDDDCDDEGDIKKCSPIPKKNSIGESTECKKSEESDQPSGWGTSERSTMDDIITFSGINKLNQMAEAISQCESERQRDDYTFAGSYEYVNLNDNDEESPIIQFTARELELSLPYDVIRGYREDLSDANDFDEPTTDESDDENCDSDESHGDLAESLHFTSDHAQERHQDSVRQETPSKRTKNSTTSSDECQNKRRDEANSSFVESRPKKKDFDSKAQKATEQKIWKQNRQRKRRVTDEKQLPEKQWSVEIASEETSEHKEETQDEENPVTNTKKRRNRKKKPGLIQRLNLTPEDLGFQSVIADSDNQPIPGETYEGFTKVTHENAATIGALGSVIMGTSRKPSKQQQAQQQRKNRPDSKEQAKSPRAQKEKTRSSPRHKPSEARDTTKVDNLRPYHIDDILAHPEWPRFIQRKARVVGVLEESASRVVCGTLRKFNATKDSLALFSPTDSRFPRMCIPAAQCPPNFMQRPQDYDDTLFCARLEHWDAHAVFPRGKLLKIIGKKGEIESETTAILSNYSIDDNEFGPDIFENMDVSPDWKIPPEVLKSRRDFRKELVFTIDPKTARDLDDAVSVKKIGDDLYEVGIHIADVSYFVKRNTALDTVAQSRATSVYMVQRVVPMLPKLLCNNLCSLHPGADKLTFSVVFKMNSQGEVLEEWFGRTLINSCCKMSYEFAQDVIDNPKRTWQPEELPEIFNGHSVAEISESILLLQKMAVKMRERRFDGGALRIDQLTLSFQLAGDGVPQGFSVYQHSASHRLIEEFMLLANMAVAHKLRRDFPSLAFLRRHVGPDERRINLIADEFLNLGVKIDHFCSKSMQSGLDKLLNTDFKLEVAEEISKKLGISDVESREALSNAFAVMLSKPFSPAQYIVAEGQSPESLRHFALAVPLYTHFTSPIRRFADLVVHRLLAESLGYDSSGYENAKELSKIASHCNEKKRAAKEAHNASVELFVWNFVRTLTDRQLEDNFIVVGVLDRSVDVISLKTGLVLRAYQDKQRCDSIVSKEGSLTFRWKCSTGGFVEMVLKVASPVKGIIEARKENCMYTVRLQAPENAILESDAPTK